MTYQSDRDLHFLSLLSLGFLASCSGGLLGLSSDLSGDIHLRLGLGLRGWLLDRSVVDLELLDLLGDLVDSGIL